MLTWREHLQRIFLSPSQTHVRAHPHLDRSLPPPLHTRAYTRWYGIRGGYTRVPYFSLHLPSAIIYPPLRSPSTPSTSAGTTGYLISHVVRKYSYVGTWLVAKKYTDVSYSVQICARYAALRYYIRVSIVSGQRRTRRLAHFSLLSYSSLFFLLSCFSSISKVTLFIKAV